MAELLTSAQMRAIERAAFDSGAVSSLEAMERAGRGVVTAALADLPDEAGRPGHAVVLCGPGNNGGDGYVVARLLHARGWRVEVFAMGDPERMSDDARANRDRWAALGPIGPLEPAVAGQGARPDLLVDALFGTGLARPIPEDAVACHEAVRGREGGAACRAVAVDAPSGLDCDTGRLLLPEPVVDAAGRPRVRADLTVTFHAAKLGHYLGEGPAACGRLAVHDIGLGAWDRPPGDPFGPPSPDRVRRVGQAAPGWPVPLVPALGAARHKYDRGHVVVLAGGPGRGGAARMAGRAALRAGAGLVTVACPTDARAENAARLDAIMLREVDAAADLDRLLEDGRLSSVCLGPGLGIGERARALVAAACRGGATSRAAGRKVVLDADALTSFADDPRALFALLHPMCVLTPHEGEFARLFPDLSQTARAEAGLSKIDAARASADRAGCTILLKGADTVIASPGGAASLHAAAYGRAVPWLATAGAGDVLAGLIAGLLAPPSITASPHPATEAAAWLHAEAARHAGPGLIAEDLPEALPAVFGDLLG
ncbi:NAD(P)H-hydrate dehydratase [Rhodovulum sp. 12E13]|uniref:NAD(P)H-hydrate dehydratase n=1 Tax=Rhodovulum sp. 12E13 TaxID=2203891 RepID=UPI000E14ABAE|nr:NAD(P)H-hydrate dehydratase [Rhodovulum sp. 12E13]RDC75387.1 NAD(P)H-hydrate dehydratase [Rhodovulum sp. 12E13]